MAPSDTHTPVDALGRPCADESAPDPTRVRPTPEYDRADWLDLRGGESAPVGIARVTALALHVTHLAVIRRATVRALLPPGRRRKKAGGGGTNTVSVRFGEALQRFDEWGWVDRLPDRLLYIVNRDALLEHAFNGLDELPDDLLRPAAALLAAEDADNVETAAQANQRRAELDALHALTDPAGWYAAHHRGRGATWRADRGLPL